MGQNGRSEQKTGAVRVLLLVGMAVGAYLAVRLLLPLLLPFLLGGAVALAAEPAVRFLQRRLPRPAAAGIGVTLTLVLLLAAAGLVGALAVRELGVLAGILPQMGQTLLSGMSAMQERLAVLSQGMPEAVQVLLGELSQELFGGGTALVSTVSERLPALLGGLLGWLPDGALGIGTGVLAGYMISVRLPGLRQAAARHLPRAWTDRVRPALGRMRRFLGQWLRAQLKLTAVVYSILSVGLLVLGIPYGPLWALPIALVDAVPVLGTGTVLLPWALVSLLQGRSLRALGLVGIYVAALLSRTVLEPRLVGHHLGIDPLVTLLALYLGYRFWGVLGIILAPVLVCAAKGAAAAR